MKTKTARMTIREKTMTTDEAQKIVDDVNARRIKCRDQIIDTSICERTICSECELNITAEDSYQYAKAMDILQNSQ